MAPMVFDVQLMFRIRTCSNSKVLSIFGIILADFRLKFQGLYTIVDMTPEILSRKAAQKNPKIDRTLEFEQVLRTWLKFYSEIFDG